MNQNINIYFWLLLSISMTFFSNCSSNIKDKQNTTIDCNQIIVSPIADQQMYQDTRIYIPLSAVTNHLDDIIFELVDGPAFMIVKKTQRGRSELVIDPTSDDVGLHTISLEATDGKKKSCLNFKVKVSPIGISQRVIHCDPKQKSSGSGSQEHPYGPLSDLLESGFVPAPNDLIVLHEGNHKDVVLSGSGYEVVSASGSTARLTSIVLSDANNITIKGLEVRPETNADLHNRYLVFIDSTSQNISLSNNMVMSTHHSENWTEQDWHQHAARGIKSLGANTMIHNNLVQNVFHGIKTEGNNITVKYNHVDRFGGDAIRNTGSKNLFSYNFLTNATVDDYHAEGGNHDDLFQSWTYDKPVDQITVSHNIMISCADTLMPLRAKIVQALVCFDGFETNWKVNDNLVVTDHPHGIALYGAENCTVTNNTVLKNPYDLYQFESDPWIMINNHKDGRLSKNNTVKNNITSALNIVSKDVKISGNIVLDSTLRKELNNYYEWDFRIKK